MSNPFDSILKQAQQVGRDMQRAARDMANVEVTGEAGGGMVKVVMSARHRVRSVSIDDSVMGDKAMLEDLLVAACNDAVSRAEQALGGKLGGMAAGMTRPGGGNP